MGKYPWNTYIHLAEMIWYQCFYWKIYKLLLEIVMGSKPRTRPVDFLGFRLTFWEGPRILKFLLSKKLARAWSFRAWPITIWKRNYQGTTYTYKNTPINNLGPVQRTTYHLCDSHEFHNNEPITTSRISRIFLVPTVLFEKKIILIMKVLFCYFSPRIPFQMSRKWVVPLISHMR